MFRSRLRSRQSISFGHPSNVCGPKFRNYTSDHYFGKGDRLAARYTGHIHLSTFERILLGFGSAYKSLYSPWRADMIAVLGETTAQPYFIKSLRDMMIADPTGRRILKDRPQISSASLKLRDLRELDENTVGKEYTKWLDTENISPDTRDPVRYIDDEEEAYVMLRYRQAHDFFHAITGLPVTVEGEIALKWFEWMNMGLPIAALSAIFGPLRLDYHARERLRTFFIPWAITNGLRAKPLINVYWEEEMHTDADELRNGLGINKPPNIFLPVINPKNR